jgi:hypothetical protein
MLYCQFNATFNPTVRYNPSVVVRFLILSLIVSVGLRAADTWTWWVDDCTGAAVRSGCQPSDAELARWAFEAWQRESGNRIIFTKSANPQHARLTVHWLSGARSVSE